MTAASVAAGREPPEPLGLPLVGHLPWIVLGSPLRFLERTQAALGPVFRLRFGNERCVVADTPDAVRHVLVDNATAYEKGSGYDPVRLLLGDGLLTAEGAAWRRQRSALAPAFARREVGAAVPAAVRCANAAADAWTRHEGTVVDPHSMMLDLSLDVAGDAFFAADLKAGGDGLGRALDDGQRAAGLFPPVLPSWVPTPRNLRLRAALTRVDRAAQTIARSGARTTALAGLIAAHADGPLLRDEIVTLVFAGHETTASVLTWTLLRLAHHGDARARLLQEIERVLGGRAPDAETLAELPYAAAVVEESMRLHPPAWWLERRALADDVVAGTEVRPGDVVGFCPAIMQRDPRLWKDPLRFAPERFLPPREVPRFAYLPFGAGHRTCIGAPLARAQLVTLLVVLLQRFAFKAATPTLPEPVCGITMRPRHARLHLHAR